MQEYVVCKIPCQHRQTDTQEYSPSSPALTVIYAIQYRMCEVLPYWPPAIQICTGSDCTGSHWYVWFAWKPEQEYSPTSSSDALGINSVEELTPTALDGISGPSSLDHSYPSTGSEVQQVIIMVSPSWTLPLLAMGVAVIPVWSTDYYSEYSVHMKERNHYN